MKKESKITNEDFLKIMKKGFNNLEKKTSEKIDNLEKKTSEKIDNLERKTDKKIEDLAIMIKNDVVDKMATKEDLRVLENRFDILENKVDDIDKNVKEINMKMHDVEESVHGEHRRRIEKLEEAV